MKDDEDEMVIMRQSDYRGKRKTGSYSVRKQDEGRCCCLVSVLILMPLMALFQWLQKGHIQPFNKLDRRGSKQGGKR